MYNSYAKLNDLFVSGVKPPMKRAVSQRCQDADMCFIQGRLDGFLPGPFGRDSIKQMEPAYYLKSYSIYPIVAKLL